MQKKLLAVAVAGALVSSAAFAQTSVTISGNLNLWYESAAATGSTAGSPGDAKSSDRIRDGAGSNIRFTVVEDMGGGMQAFGQVESAVFGNADTRADSAGKGGAGQASTTAGGNVIWANRNSGVGLRSNAWGEILMGIWDLHYHEHYAVDSHILRGSSNSNSLGLLNQFGTSGITSAAGTTGTAPVIGNRYSNVIRYQSPSWSGFNFRLAYARPTDGVPPNTPGVVGDDKRNKVWNFAPSYSAGPILVGYSYLKDKDIVTGGVTWWGASAASTIPGAAANVGAATCSTAAACGAASGVGVGNTWDVTSHRFMGAYTFPMGFKIGFIYDRSKLNGTQGIVAGGATTTSEIKRDVWVLPLAYTAGAHQVHFNYGVAKSWKGNLQGTDLGTLTVTPPTVSPVTGLSTVAGTTAYTVSGNTGAKMISLGYQYDLSKRTNLHLTYAQIKNDALAGYDFFSTNVGIAAGGYGSDPRVYSIGLRHAF